MVAVAVLVILGASLTFKINCWAAVPAAPPSSLTLRKYCPPVPAVGVPLIVASLPEDVNDKPLGSSVPRLIVPVLAEMVNEFGVAASPAAIERVARATGAPALPLLAPFTS
jgi:hypothetical protein